MGMPFAAAATLNLILALSFPAIFIYPVILIFGLVSYFAVVKFHRSSSLKDREYNFFLKNIKVFVIIVILQALIMWFSWDTYKFEVDWSAPYVQPGGM